MRPQDGFKVRPRGVVIVIDRVAEVSFGGGHRLFLVCEETLYQVGWYVNRIVPKSRHICTSHKEREAALGDVWTTVAHRPDMNGLRDLLQPSASAR
jgi:hypothetical protein